MSEQIENPDMVQDPVDHKLDIPDELTMLKNRADMSGLVYHPSIGVDKLRKKLEAHLKTTTTPEVPSAPVPTTVRPLEPHTETEAEMRVRLRKAAGRLVRVRVTCMNPNKKDWEGEIYTVSNSIAGTFKKYVPFNAEKGWHVPEIIFRHMKERKCQIFYTTKDDRGGKTRQGKIINELSIEVLPPLTLDEIHDLAQQQAMAAGKAA